MMVAAAATVAMMIVEMLPLALLIQAAFFCNDLLPTIVIHLLFLHVLFCREN